MQAEAPADVASAASEPAKVEGAYEPGRPDIGVINDCVSGECIDTATFAEISKAGGMVLKVDVSEIDKAGILGTGDITVFFDPTCETCPDLDDALTAQKISFKKAPVAFYKENGLDLVGAFLCKELSLENPSDDCTLKAKSMINNTNWLMRQGVVELPAALLPSGWLLEDVQEGDDFQTRFKGDQGG